MASLFKERGRVLALRGSFFSCILALGMNLGLTFAADFSQGEDPYSYEKLVKLISPKPLKKNFLKKWISSPLKKNENGEAKIYTRLTAVAGRIFPIGHLYYFKFKGEDFKGKEMIDRLEKNFEGKWKKSYGVRKTTGEGYWRGGNRYVRYAFSVNPHKKSEIIMTLFSGRIGYWDSTYPEALFMQDKLGENFQGEKTTSHSFLRKIFPWIEEVQAQDFSSLFKAAFKGGLLPGTKAIVSLNSNISSFSETFKNLEGQLSSLNSKVSNNLREAKSTQGASGGGDLDLGNSTNHLVVEVSDTNQVIDENWDRTNAEIARINDIAEKALDPKNAFTLAAATSAGAVVGACLAHSAIDLMLWGANAAFKAITGTKGKAERWEKFKEARKRWEENLKVAKGLEKVLDNFLISQALMRKIASSLSDDDRRKLSREDLISHLSINTRRLKKKYKKLEDKFNETISPSCEAHYARQLDEVDKLVKQFVSLKKILQESSFEVYNDAYFCEELPRILGKLAEAEAQLAEYRLDILSARTEWAENERERLGEMTEKIRRLNKSDSQEEFIESQIKNAMMMFDKIKDGLDDIKEVWVRKCAEERVEKMPSSKRTRQVWGGRSHDLVMARSYCKKIYDREKGEEVEARLKRARHRRDQKIAKARAGHKNIRHNYTMNYEVEDQRLMSYQKFFDDVREQQYCFENPKEMSCQKKAKIKFMGPFYVKDRAMIQMKKICGHDDLMSIP